MEVLRAGPDDGQWRPQLVAGVGGELALAAQRVADRDERPARDEPAGGEAARIATRPPTASTVISVFSVFRSAVMSWPTCRT